MLPLRHAGRTAAVASRLSRAAGAQIAARTAEQLFVTLGEFKSGAAKLGQAMSVFEAAMPKVRARSHPSAPHPLSRDRGPARRVRLRRRERNRDTLDAQAR